MTHPDPGHIDRTRAFDFARFELREVLRCGNDVRKLTAQASSLEDAARVATSYFYDAARDPEGNRLCALVRCFVTRPLGTLDAELQHAAREAVGGAALPPGTNCLVLLASAGDEPNWCDRRRSVGHRAIPLTSADAVRATPMIAQLIQSFGVRIEDIVGQVDPQRLLRATGGKSYGVFHVENAVESPYIPAQQGFVAPYSIRSVLGFGAALSTGDVFAVIIFSRATIPASTADRFRSVALELKGCLHRFGASDVFTDPVDTPVS